MYKRLLTFLMAFVLFSATVVAESVGYTINAEDQTADCSGATINNVEPGGTVNYKAQWEANPYIIAYAGGSTGGTSSVSGNTDSQTVTFDYTNISLQNCNFSAPGYHFTGWQSPVDLTNGDLPGSPATYVLYRGSQSSLLNGDYTGGILASYGYDSSSATPANTVTLTAQWAPNQYSVTYNCGESRLKENVDPTDAVIFDRQYPYRTSSDVCEDLSQRSFSFWWCAEGYYDANNEFVPISDNEQDLYMISDGADGNGNEWNYVNDLWCLAIWSDCPRGYHKTNGDKVDCELTTYHIGYHNVNNEDWENNANHPTDYTIETSMPMSISNPKDRETQEFKGWCVGDNTCSVPVADFSVTVNTNGYATDCLVDGNMSNTCINLYAQWDCKEGYELDSETGKCERKKYDISYGSGLHGSVPNQGADPVVYTDGLTYNQTWRTKAFGQTTIVADGGYTFDKWNTMADGSGTSYEADADQSVWTTDAGLTLYAIYAPNPYQITYDCGGVTITVDDEYETYTAEGQVSSTDVTMDGRYELRENACILTGYTFAGWECPYLPGIKTLPEEADSENKLYFEEGATGTYSYAGNVTCTAQWTPNKYDIIYRPGEHGTGGKTVEDALTYGETYVPVSGNDAQITANSGYEFVGWSKTQGSSTADFCVATASEACEEQEAWAEDNDLTLYAIYKPLDFEIELDKNENNGGATNSAPTTLYTRYATGVYRDADRETMLYSIGEADNPSPALTSAPVGKTVTLRFNANLPSGLPSTTDTSRTGHADEEGQMSFGGFYDNQTGEGTQYINKEGRLTSAGNAAGKAATSNQTWYAHYDCVELPLPNGQQLKGYEFAGWYDAPTDGNKQGGEDNKVCLRENTTLYARWDSKPYTITYEKGEVASAENMPDAQVVRYNAAYELSNDEPTATGYTFAGWYCPNLPGIKTLPADADPENRLYFASGATGIYTRADNTTCTAQWTPNTYTVTYYKGMHAGEQSADSFEDTVVYNSRYYSKKFRDTPFEPADGYIFCGWNENPEANCEAEGFVSWAETTDWPVDGNKTVFAVYKPASYQITFDCGNAPAGASTTLRTGDNMTSIDVRYKGNYEAYHAAPTAQECSLDGYKFNGWQCNPSSVEIAFAKTLGEELPTKQPVYNITDNTVCHATWKQRDYEILYSCGEEAKGSYDNQPVTFDKNYELNDGTKCSLEGYTINSTSPWVCDHVSAMSGRYTHPGNTKCNANWGVNSYNVVYTHGAHSNSNSRSVPVAYGARYSLASNTVLGILPLSGYVFDKWNCNQGVGERNTGYEFSMPANTVTCEALWKCATNYGWDSDEHTECVPDEYTITYVYIDNDNKNVVIDDEYKGTHQAHESETYSYGQAKSYPATVNIPGYEIPSRVVWHKSPTNPSYLTETTGFSNVTTGDITVYTFVSRFTCPDDYPHAEPGANTNSQCWKECEPAQEHYTLQPNGRVYYPGTDTTECVYLPDEYTITYIYNGHGRLEDGVSNPETYNYDTRYAKNELNPLEPIADDENDAGYAFEGWYDNASFEGEPVTFVPDGRVGSFTLWAKWGHLCPEGKEWSDSTQKCEEKVYNIYYELNGGHMKSGENNPNSFSWSQRNEEWPLNMPEKDDEIFRGWYGCEDFNCEPAVAVVPGGRTDDFTLYAKWSNVAIVKFDCTNDVEYQSDDVEVGDLVPAPLQGVSSGTRRGCEIETGELVGWKCDDGHDYNLVNGVADIVVTRTGLTKCSAVIDLSNVEFNIIYKACDDNGNQIVIPDDVSADWPKVFKPSRKTLYPESLSLDEYRFDGWFTQCRGGNSRTGTTNVAHDITIYAHLRQVPPCSETQYLDENSLVCQPCPRAGRFVFPYADDGATSINECYRLCVADKGYTPNPERIYYSQRNDRIQCGSVPNEYWLTYKDGDIVVEGPVTYTYGTEVTLRNHSKPGYVFNGWCDGAETCTTKLKANSKQTGWIGDKILYAQLTPKDYPIVYKDGNQTIDTFEDVYYTYKVTDNVELKPEYVKTGYVFHGWKDTNNHSISGWEAGSAPADTNGTVTVYADLEAIDYHVNYYCDTEDDAAEASDVANFGESYVYRTKVGGRDLCNSSFAEGYTFNKWRCLYSNNTFDVDGNRVDSWNIAGDVNCYAVQEASPYNITYFDGTLEFAGLNPDKYTIIENITLPRLTDYPDILVKTGYKFIGWKDAEDTDVVGWNAGAKTGDVAVYAQWECATNYHWGDDAHTVCEPDMWPITYKYKNEILTGLTPSSYAYGVGATLPLDAGVTHDSYKFDGWCTGYDAATNTYSGCGVTSVGTNETGEKVFYATWKFVCESGKWWHVGNEKICLYNDKPANEPAVRINTANGKSYLLLKEGQEDLPINRDSQKKFHILKGDRGYNAYDKSVENW